MATGRWFAGRGFTDQALGQFDAAARKAGIMAELDPDNQAGPGLYLEFRARLEAFEAMGAMVADLRRLLAEQKRLRQAALAALARGHDLSPSQRAELEAWSNGADSP